MPKGIVIVLTSPSDPSREEEFNDWYTNTHLADVRAVPGVVGAKRYKLHDPEGKGGPAGHSYLAIYEIEADDLTAPMAELRARSGAGRARTSDAVGMDPPPVVTHFELIEET